MIPRSVHPTISKATSERVGRDVFVEPERSVTMRCWRYVPFCPKCSRSLCGPEQDVVVSDTFIEDHAELLASSVADAIARVIAKSCRCEEAP